jgi:sulfhydrogenase subunit alpha
MARIIIDPLTRVEGHGRVELILRDGHLTDVQVRMLESPRLFEKMVVGRKYDDVAELVCRICAICSAVHKLTALEAIEQALEVDIPPLARMVRKLLLLGGHIQSHALHLYCLILPDFSGDVDVVALLKRGDPLAATGLKLKALGNRIQEVAGGRVIHPVSPRIGGLWSRPATEDLTSLAEDLVAWQQDWPSLAQDFLAAAQFPPAVAVAATSLAVGASDRFDLKGDVLRVGDRLIPVADYRTILQEQTPANSYAKDSCGTAGPFLVGALARARLVAGKESTAAQDDIHANNRAQIDEIGWALNQARELTETILTTSADAPLRQAPGAHKGGVGTAANEAPRGLLIHHYVIDEWGHIAAADVVTPTAINQRAMREQILHDLAGQQDPVQMRATAERIVRAFDPCISCAVHLLDAGSHDAPFSTRVL